MKSFHSKLAGIAPWILFPLLIIHRKRRKGVYIIIVLATLTFSSCYNTFFRTNTKPYIDAETASKLKSENKYFIIHFKNSINGLEQLTVNDDSLYGKVVLLPQEHSLYLQPDSDSKANKVKKTYKANTLIETHLYTNTELKNDDSLFAAKLSSFYRADIYELNKSATTRSTILSTFGIVATSVVLVGLIAAAISCNCPQVYVEDNGTYNYVSGVYSGAVYSTMERMDYLPLTSVPANAGSIDLRIANTENEEQFINKAELVQVNHKPGTNVLPDRHGNLLTYRSLQQPLTALTTPEDDIKNVLLQKDSLSYGFNNAVNTSGFSDVVLTFDKPEKAVRARLLINARNTFWAGLLHKEFLNLFGENFEKWREKQEKADPKKLEQWQTDQALPLMVYIRINDEWKFVDYFPLVGNAVTRDMIMEINTAAITGDKIELKLETAYRFWDIDFAGIDYSNEEPITTDIILPTEILKSDSTDQRAALLSNDKAYTHLAGDEYISFRYTLPAPVPGIASSYFLAGGGYYHNLETLTGKTNYKELYKFRKKGAFDKFSREKYKEAENISIVLKDYYNR